jgi:hypothetical protein
VIVMTGLCDGPMVDRARQMKVNAILTKGKASLEDVRRAIEEELPRLPSA